MKQFLFLIAKTLLLLVLTAGCLDMIYTYVYLRSSNRSKVEAIFNGKPTQYDVVILGTSRANNHFVPELFEKKRIKNV